MGAYNPDIRITFPRRITATGTQEVSANVNQVTEAAAQTGASATQVLGAARELAEQSENLRAKVEEFLANIRAA